MHRKQLGLAVMLWSVAGIALSVLLAVGQPPQPNPELTRILDLMERRQKQAGIIRIKAEGTRFRPKGAETEQTQSHHRSGTELVPPQDELTELRQNITFDFVGQRYRRLYSEKRGSQLDSWIGIYDGKKSYGSKADLPIEQLESFNPSDMSVTSGAGQGNIFHSGWWPYLISAGFIMTQARQPYYMSEFSLPLDRENLFVHGQAIVHGVPCLILRMFPYGPKGREQFFEYAVGRNDGAVRRMTDWRPGRKDLEITISYRKIGDRLAPTRWVNLWYQSQSPGRLYQSEKMTVTEFETGDELAEPFTLTPATGAAIRERQYAENLKVIREKDEKVVHYQVDESGRWVAGEWIDGEFIPHRRVLGWWIGGGLLVVVMGLLSWRSVRRRTRAATNPETGEST